VLVAGQLGRFDGSGRAIARRRTDVARYLAWTQGQLVFTDTRLDEVARQLERWYDVEVQLRGDDIRGLRVTGAFGDAPASNAIDEIARTLGLRLRRAGNRYELARARS